MDAHWRWPLAIAAAVLLCAALTALASQLWDYGRDGPVTNPTDFRVFYCAGAALDRGADPYRVEPLRTCERKTLASAGLHMDPRKFLPAPLPPYALLLFALIASLPYRLASELWFALGIMALCVAIVAVQRLSGLRPVVVAVALFGALGFASLIYGQVVPFVVAALAVAALAARRGDGGVAALCAAVAALEPHLALPAWLGLWIFVRPSRVPLLLAGIVLFMLSPSAVGNLNHEYFTAVLPQHARSELASFGGQYSLASLLYAFGAGSDMALRIGSLSYVVMLGAGLWLAAVLQRRYADPAFAVVTPVAAVLLGGAFIHGHQMAAALPLGLMLAGLLRGHAREQTCVIAAVVALAIPWQTLAEVPFVVAYLPAKPIVAAEPRLPAVRGRDLAEVPYAAYIKAFADRNDPRTRLEQVVWKLPTWFGLMLLLGAAAWRPHSTPGAARRVSAQLEGRGAAGI